MRFEVQRLLLQDVRTVTVFDVAAILRAISEVGTCTVSDLWRPDGLMSELVSIHDLTPRRLIWFVGPCALRASPVGDNELAAAHRELTKLLPGNAVIRSREPLSGVLAALGVAARSAALVTAGLERHPYELHALARVAEELDIETGKSWSRVDVFRKFGVTPLDLPLLCATTGSPPYWPCLARPRTDLMKYSNALAKALTSALPPDQANIPPTVREQIQWALPRIDVLAEELRGVSASDLLARQQLELALHVPALSPSPLTAYVVTNVDFGTASPTFVSAEALVGGAVHTANGDGPCRVLLSDVRAAVPSRWFAPRALDMLAALAAHGAPLPTSAVDPGLVNYVFNTEQALNPADYCPAARLLSAEQLEWMVDLRRETEAPLAGIIGALPALDDQLHALLVQENLIDLVEDDLGGTLPVLARIERRGAHFGRPGGFANWAAFDAAVSTQQSALEQALMPVLGSLNPYGPLAPIVGRLLAQHPLSSEELRICPKSNDRLVRLAARGSAAAKALVELRSITSTVAYWRPLLFDGAEVRGKWTPQRTGRWGLRSPPLTSLPKHGLVGDAIRGALVAPPDHAFVVADYNAYEGRLLAAASQDPLLVDACEAPDFHQYVARHVFGRDDDEARAWAKNVLYAMAYGQTPNGFVRERHELLPAEARRIYRRVRKHLATARRFQKEKRAEYNKNRTLPVKTPGGWERFAVTWRQAFNTGIQAHAADIFRWVLRALDRELVDHGAFVTHQMHDEVFVVAPKTRVLDVASAMKRVMEHDVVQYSGLLPSGVRLVADVTIRTSWREE